MSAAEAVRAALVEALSAQIEFAGVEGLRGDAAPSALPQARVDAEVTGDWSTKTAEGRELRTMVTIRVSRGQALRLPMMAAAVERAGTALSGTIDGWQIGSAVLLRNRSTAGTDGTRITTVEHRIRVLKN